MSTRATLWYSEEDETHLYREMGENTYWLETPFYKIFIPESLGVCLDSVIIPNKEKKPKLSKAHIRECPICQANIKH